MLPDEKHREFGVCLRYGDPCACAAREFGVLSGCCWWLPEWGKLTGTEGITKGKLVSGFLGLPVANGKCCLSCVASVSVPFLVQSFALSLDLGILD